MILDPQHVKRKWGLTTRIRHESRLEMRKDVMKGFLILCGVMLLLSGCGYQFTAGGPGPFIGKTADTERLRELQTTAPRLIVLKMQNNSFEANLARNYTEFLRREFQAGSGARMVSEISEADLQLKSSIISVTYPSITFSQSQTAESRAVVTVAATVEDIRTRKVVWSQQATSSSEYFVTSDLQFNQVLQRRAVRQAGEYIASDLADRFLTYLETRSNSAQDGSVEEISPGRTPSMTPSGPKPVP